MDGGLQENELACLSKALESLLLNGGLGMYTVPTTMASRKIVIYGIDFGAAWCDQDLNWQMSMSDMGGVGHMWMRRILSRC